MKYLINKEVLDVWDNDQARVKAFRKVWGEKKVLRKIYYDKWEDMLVFAREGPILEIGSGPGFFKKYCKRSISMDVFVNPWLDVVGDGTKLPFKNESFATIIFVDVFHHVHNALEYMSEIERVLKKGGRLILEEPFISPLSYFVYRLHHEGLNMKADLNDSYKQHPDKKPLDANLATPTLMFCKDFDKARKYFPKLELIHIKKQDCFFLLLYGNFTYKQVFPTFMYYPLKFLEKVLGPLKNIMAFKILVVMEKSKKDNPVFF